MASIFELFAKNREDPDYWTPHRLADYFNTREAWIRALLQYNMAPTFVRVRGRPAAPRPLADVPGPRSGVACPPRCPPSRPLPLRRSSRATFTAFVTSSGGRRTPRRAARRDASRSAPSRPSRPTRSTSAGARSGGRRSSRSSASWRRRRPPPLGPTPTAGTARGGVADPGGACVRVCVQVTCAGAAGSATETCYGYPAMAAPPACAAQPNEGPRPHWPHPWAQDRSRRARPPLPSLAPPVPRPPPPPQRTSCQHRPPPPPPRPFQPSLWPSQSSPARFCRSRPFRHCENRRGRRPQLLPDAFALPAPTGRAGAGR